ncbi:MAG: DUF4111 domain-containing protein [Coriobacteriia bacterium]|nr:DUF4111 domain-containing protein [Coriobacteriia bacterium]
MNETTNEVLGFYADELLKAFGDDLVGVYATGSLAVGDYYEGKSDKDLTVVLKQPVGSDKAKELLALHRLLEKKYPKAKVESQYVTLGELSRDTAEIEPILAYHDRKMSRSYFNVNPVTWLTLRDYGLTVAGLPAAELGITTTVEETVAYVKANVEGYWQSWAARAKSNRRLLGIYSLSDAAIEWGVSGISRMLYTVNEGRIASKDAALEYMMEKSPQKHQAILGEALRIRSGQGVKAYRSRFQRRREMIGYMEYVIALVLAKA